MATEIQQVKISQLNTISDWRNAYTIATDRNGQSVKAPLEQVSKIGDLSELDTTDKSSLVAAINEAATMADITVDSALSSISTNPVQNKVINTALAGKQATISDLATIRSGASAGATAVQPAALSTKQDALVSGTNIKTINGASVLGSGNMTIDVADVVKYAEQSLTDAQKTQARTNIGAASLADINNTEYVTVTTLPTASAATVGPIYLVGPDANNNYARWITQEGNGSYSWVSLGSTEIDISGKADSDAVCFLGDVIETI